MKERKWFYLKLINLLN